MDSQLEWLNEIYPTKKRRSHIKCYPQCTWSSQLKKHEYSRSISAPICLIVTQLSISYFNFVRCNWNFNRSLNYSDRSRVKITSRTPFDGSLWKECRPDSSKVFFFQVKKYKRNCQNKVRNAWDNKTNVNVVVQLKRSLV